MGSVAIGMGASATAAGATGAAPRITAPGVTTPGARTWITLDPPWLCRVWQTPSSFVRHCTAKWHVDARGQVISDDPAWVPMAGADVDSLASAATWFHRDAAATLLWERVPHRPAPVARTARPKRPTLVYTAPRRTSSGSGTSGTGSSGSGSFGLWTPPPGHPAYALPDFPGDPNAGSWGFCTWYAQYRRPSEGLRFLGNAWQWAYNAPKHGLRTGTVPVVGATVVFQPGVLGASALGHVGHVEAVYSGGWFLISEMNMTWNGGGFGRVSFRYARVVSGVSFIY
jgi:hypothetical protein